MRSVAWASALSAAGAFLILYALPRSAALWICGVPAVIAAVAAARRAGPTEQRLTALSCSVPPAAAIGFAYWQDVSRESGYLIIWGLAGVTLVVFAVIFGVILALLRLVDRIGGPAA